MKLKVIAQDAEGNRWESSIYESGDNYGKPLTEQQMLEKLKHLPLKQPLSSLRETPNFLIKDNRGMWKLANS